MTDRPPRLASRLLVDALRRRVDQAGGFATIVQCGNDMAGSVIIECRDRGTFVEILEQATDFEGISHWRRIAPPDAASANWLDDYRARRVVGDPDLWWIELDVAGAARFADELMAER